MDTARQPLTANVASNNAPPQQQMNIPMGPEFLANTEAILIRQRLQIFEQFCTICEKSNKYNIAVTSSMLANRDPPLTDQEFWTQPQIGFIKEQSSCLCRSCCNKWRELQLGFYANEQRAMAAGDGGLPPADFFSMDRPFKCSFPCWCVMCCPQEATFRAPNSQVIGSAQWDWRCCRFAIFGELYIAIRDGSGQITHYIRPYSPTCCNGCRNFAAPSCCNKAFHADILDANEMIVGNYRDTYPGTIGCRCLSDASNFSMTFPVNATPIQKANLLGGLMLLEYMLHEKSPNNQNQAAAIM